MKSLSTVKDNCTAMYKVVRKCQEWVHNASVFESFLDLDNLQLAVLRSDQWDSCNTNY